MLAITLLWTTEKTAPPPSFASAMAGLLYPIADVNEV